MSADFAINFLLRLQAGFIANLATKAAMKRTDFTEATRETRIYRRGEWSGQPLEVQGRLCGRLLAKDWNE
jgi:hypothetical protein